MLCYSILSLKCPLMNILITVRKSLILFFITLQPKISFKIARNYRDLDRWQKKNMSPFRYSYFFSEFFS